MATREIEFAGDIDTLSLGKTVQEVIDEIFQGVSKLLEVRIDFSLPCIQFTEPTVGDGRLKLTLQILNDDEGSQQNLETALEWVETALRLTPGLSNIVKTSNSNTATCPTASSAT